MGIVVPPAIIVGQAKLANKSVTLFLGHNSRNTAHAKKPAHAHVLKLCSV